MKGRGGIPIPELVPKCALSSLEPTGYPLDGNCAIRHTVCAFSFTLKESFNGDGAVVSYLSNVRTTKETDRCADRE